MTPAQSWALLAAVGVATVALVVVIARLDRTLDDALTRRRSRRRRVRGFDEAHRYQLAREAIERQMTTSNVRIGHHDTTKRETSNNDD